MEIVQEQAARICVVCGCGFPVRTNAKTCSAECAKRFRKTYERGYYERAKSNGKKWGRPQKSSVAALGALRDNPETARRAAEYLERHRRPRLLLRPLAGVHDTQHSQAVNIP